MFKDGNNVGYRQGTYSSQAEVDMARISVQAELDALNATISANNALSSLISEGSYGWNEDELGGTPLSFSGGGHVSGPDGGYTTGVTFHGNETILPDSEIGKLGDKLDKVAEYLFMIVNLSGDKKELLSLLLEYVEGNIESDAGDSSFAIKTQEVS